ncbi:metallophosphoesterase [Paenibacillus sp. 1P03SA]|uniref:metallophosphoesterase n=1 Tax=Paenibacillus sp. 1P03SA TaxID=3132294 RepID=UPI0039A3F16F
MHIQTRIHTIFMLVGSTECGKTTFAKEVLIPGLQFEASGKAVRANIQYLSSDRIRQEILGFDYDKYDQIMLESSGQAFQFLFERLKMATSFPVNAEFVVVDTTGLAEDFREKVRAVAKENNYNLEVILFDYRKRHDYYASERSKKLITSHINRLKQDVMGSLSREGYTKIHKVRAKDFYFPEEGKANEAYTVEIADLEEYLAAVLPQEDDYIIVGDVHECVDDLKGLLLDYGFKFSGNSLELPDKLGHTKIVLTGDWIDKGRQTRATVEFLYENREHFLFVLGNHENFVYKYLKGEIGGVEEELFQSYFTSVETLRKDTELLRKFNELVEMSKPFYRKVGTRGPSFYVTHSPCRNKYIGKLDGNSARHQRNFRLDRGEPFEEQLAFLKEEAVKNHPFHVFGHVAAKNAFWIGNKVHVDTGCVNGNKLTAVSLSFKPFFKSRAAGEAVLPEELPVLFREERKVTLGDLDAEELRRLHYCSRNRINTISGTMSPADKDEAAGELESLRQGLRYFADHGVDEVVLQPKYMGSRCQIYLHRDPDHCYGVSRNGYKIKGADLSGIFRSLLDKFGSYMEENKIAVLLLDGELLPWHALGEGLIERQFRPIEKALEAELDFLKANGFEEAFGKLAETYAASGFEKDQFTMPKARLSEKYGASVYQNYKHMRGLLEKRVPLEEHEAAYRTYKRQLELYGEPGEPEYKPFAILKIIHENGEEEIPQLATSEMYAFLSEDKFLLLNLSDPESYPKAEAYFESLTTGLHMEGVVIKPELPGTETVPYMKVRSRDYLTLVYGYDYRFPHKYAKLMKQKNIRLKLRTSLNEYLLGQKMLAVKYGDIAPDHEGYKEAAANVLFEVAKEKEIDPRL